METLDLLKEVLAERVKSFEYDDERVFSNLLYTSYSRSLRAINGYPLDLQEKYKSNNQWLESKCPDINKISVINFDKVKDLIDKGKCSCDAFFYNFNSDKEHHHLLIEFKSTNKSKVLEYIKDTGNDGLYAKVSNSVSLIKSNIKFGGFDEGDDIICNTHLCIVYNGKNNVPSPCSLNLPRKGQVDKSSNNKQKRASFQNSRIERDINPICSKFSAKLERLKLAKCTEDYFSPAKTLPEAKKCGRKKTKQFSLFSADDFADLINIKFFDNWPWGSYKS